MRKEVKNNNIRWINIINPGKKDVEFLDKNFNIYRSVLEEYIPLIKKPKIEEYKDHLFIVIHFPVFNNKTRKTTSAELDIVLFKNVIITSHTKSLPELEKIFNKCKSDEIERNHYVKNSAVYLAFKVLDEIIEARMLMLDHIDDRIVYIEEEIFSGNERKMVGEIAVVKHDIISFRRIIKPQKIVLEELSKMALKITDENLSGISSEIINSNIKVWNTLVNHKEMIEALEHTNESLLSYKLNDTMKILTAFSVIVLPLSLIANAFGMNVTNGMPFINSPFGFWTVLLIMISVTLVSILFFKHKNWI